MRACCGLVRHFYDGVPSRQGRERNTDHACLVSCQYDCTKSSYNDLNVVQKHSDHPLSSTDDQNETTRFCSYIVPFQLSPLPLPFLCLHLPTSCHFVPTRTCVYLRGLFATVSLNIVIPAPFAFPVPFFRHSFASLLSTRRTFGLKTGGRNDWGAEGVALRSQSSRDFSRLVLRRRTSDRRDTQHRPST